jgi:RNA polymerase sigma-70 factor (ECF subfamily)
LAQLQSWLLRDHADAEEVGVRSAGLALPDAVELERRYQAEMTQGGGPELGFRRGFAIEVLDRAYARLRAEAREAGSEQMFEVLDECLLRSVPAGHYQQLAERLATRPLALMLAARRLRERYCELVDEELADTVSGPTELEAEREALLSVLQGDPAGAM